MTARIPRAPLRLTQGVALGLFVLSGCTPANPLEGAGVRVRPGAEWRPEPLTRWAVPGTPLAAWSGPNGSSLVVYQTLPVPGPNVANLVTARVNRLTGLPGLKVVAQDTTKVAGLDAGRVEVVAPGTGDALVPTGAGTPFTPPGATLKPTRRVVVEVPRPGDTLVLVWHAPDDEAGKLEPLVRATLESAAIERSGPATASY